MELNCPKIGTNLFGKEDLDRFDAIEKDNGSLSMANNLLMFGNSVNKHVVHPPAPNVDSIAVMFGRVPIDFLIISRSGCNKTGMRI